MMEMGNPDHDSLRPGRASPVVGGGSYLQPPKLEQVLYTTSSPPYLNHTDAAILPYAGARKPGANCGIYFVIAPQEVDMNLMDSWKWSF